VRHAECRMQNAAPRRSGQRLIVFRYYAHLEERVHRLQDLVSQLAPDVNLDDESAASPSGLANFEAGSHATGASPLPRDRSHDQLSRLITGGLPDQSTGDVHSQSPVAPIPPVIHPPPAPHPSSLSPLRPLPPPRVTNRTRTVATPTVAAPTEALEVQPRSALGYEWDERHQKSWKDHDGTASLSVEPDGEGYLGASHATYPAHLQGFASGATLLRILQIAAGGVSLSQIGPVIQTAHAAAPEQLSYSEQCRFLDGYFAHYHPQYPLVHEPTFRAQWNEVIARPPQSS
jgi:transcriptional regulatory protein GAL4